MSTSITVRESSHRLWKTGTIASAVLCILFFAIFWNTPDPFWTGIFRFGAFIFFAIAMMGYLKLMDGPMEITLSYDQDSLLVSYFKKGKEIQEEQFEKNTIEKIVPTRPSNDFLTLIQPDVATFQIDFNDTDRDLYLFEFRGRPLLFNEHSQTEIKKFLKDID